MHRISPNPKADLDKQGTSSYFPTTTIVRTIIKNVMSSATEAKIAAAFLTARDSIPIQKALQEMGHPQPPTPIQTNNSIADSFLNESIKQKHSKEMDMQFWWLLDKVNKSNLLFTQNQDQKN